jgi:hypothetical protein
MSEIAVCAVAFGEKYTWRLGRMKETLQDTNPGVRLFSWADSMPDGARPFNESMYGFKPHAIKIARDSGYKKIFWIDCTCVVQDKLDYYEQFTDEYKGVLAVKDDNKLTRFCSDKALKYIDKPRTYLHDKHLVGGSLYYFDFNNPNTEYIFGRWMEAELKGLFGSMVEECGERLQGHRSDETMMSLFLYEAGSRPFDGATRYNWEKGGIVQKMHFK